MRRRRRSRRTEREWISGSNILFVRGEKVVAYVESVGHCVDGRICEWWDGDCSCGGRGSQSSHFFFWDVTLVLNIFFIHFPR